MKINSQKDFNRFVKLTIKTKQSFVRTNCNALAMSHRNVCFENSGD